LNWSLVRTAQNGIWLVQTAPARRSRHPQRSQIQPIVAVHCVDSNNGYAASLPEREQKVRPGAITRAKRLTVSASKRRHRVNPKRESPAGVRKWIRFIALTRSANLKTCEQCVPRISTRHALPPSGRTRRRQKRQRGIRVSARIRNSGVLWGMSLPRSHPRPCHQAV
jgi:hypothetical protein